MAPDQKCFYGLLRRAVPLLILLFNLQDLFSHSLIFVQVGQGQVKGNCYGVICKTVGAISKQQGFCWGGKGGPNWTQEALLDDWFKFYGPVVSKVFFGCGRMVMFLNHAGTAASLGKILNMPERTSASWSVHGLNTKYIVRFSSLIWVEFGWILPDISSEYLVSGRRNVSLQM